MQILFLSTWFPYPPDNGSKIRVYHLLQALSQKHDVTLLSFAFDTARPEAAADLNSWCRAAAVVPVDPFAVNQAGTWQTFLSSRPMASRPVPLMRELVAQTIQSQSFDAVIASTEMMADYALSLPAATAKILEEHNSMSQWMWERYATAQRPLQRIRCWLSWQKQRWYASGFLPKFDLITMVSEADCAATAATVGEGQTEIALVPNGVDCRNNPTGLLPTSPNSLIYNGALTYSANYNAMRYFLAEIWPLLRTEIPDVVLTITGSTKGVDLAGLPLTDKVLLSGYVDDIRPLVAGAAVCVVPLRQGGGTRLKILEAMALGTAVVSTSKGAEGLAVQDGVHLLLADRPDLFAQQVVRLLRDEPLRHELALQARQLVETEYDWAQIGAQFVALVEETVRRVKG